MSKRFVAALLGIVTTAFVLTGPTSAVAQSDTGDLLGDLVHIKRDATTGQPILQERWVEFPGGTLGWDYCPIPIDIDGVEIPFAPLSCDPDPAQASRLVEVNYFGRLSGGRTKERNQRMHFDEVIVNINGADLVDVDEGGRLKLGTTCDVNGVCASWKTIDSPMENLALYRRMLKYGHLQTDPLEVDTSSGGDPNAGTVYHPALTAADWAKFRGVTTTLLPSGNPNQCFAGVTFVASCAQPQALAVFDFSFATSFLAGAADKTGKVTPDLVQYLNRILKVPVATAESAAPVVTLPALIRDVNGNIAPAPPGLPFPANERFVDFSNVSYLRTDWFDRATLVLQTSDAGLTWRPTTVQLLQWLMAINGPRPATETDMPGFIGWGTDALRVVEFIHEYALPADLWVGGTGTHTNVRGAMVRYRATNQSVTLSATVGAPTAVNGGTVTFSLRAADGSNVGVAVISGAVVNGAASATMAVPGGTGPQTLSITAVYSGTTGLASSAGSGSLVIGLADTTTTVDAALMPVPAAATAVPLTARVGWADTVLIGEGTVTFEVTNGAGAVIGAPLTTAVTAGVATAAYPMPGGLAAQRLVTTAVFNPTANFAGSRGTNVLSVGCLAVTIVPFTMPKGTVGQAYAVHFTTDGVPPTVLTATGLPAGLTLTGALLSGTPASNGDFTVTVAATDAAGCTGSATYTLSVSPSTNTIAVGPDQGVPGVVRHFEPNGTQVNAAEYAPFSMAWTGGVRVARADFTADGVPDTIVAAGPGAAPLIQVYNGVSQALIGSALAFEPSYTGGVNVAAGDIDGDGTPDIIVATSTGPARLKVFNGRTAAVMFDVVLGTTGVNGLQVASGDFNGDGRSDVVVGAGAGIEPRVRVYDAATGAVLHDFLAYAADFRGGVFVAAGDLNGDGRADLITGAGAGGGPHVKAFNGVTGAAIRDFFAFDPAFTGGVRVAAADLNGDGRAEIVTGAGPGGAPQVKVFHGATNAEISSFLAYPTAVTSGVFVGVPWRPLTVPPAAAATAAAEVPEK